MNTGLGQIVVGELPRRIAGKAITLLCRIFATKCSSRYSCGSCYSCRERCICWYRYGCSSFDWCWECIKLHKSQGNATSFKIYFPNHYFLDTFYRGDNLRCFNSNRSICVRYSTANQISAWVYQSKRNECYGVSLCGQRFRCFQFE